MVEAEWLISLCQMDIAVGNPTVNLTTAHRMVEEASRRGSRMVVLPELWSTGYNLPEIGEMAEREQAGWLKQVSGWAREFGLYLYAGSLAEREGSQTYNTSRLFGPDGRELAAYRKIHRVPMLDEEKYLAAGDRGVVCPVAPLPLGMLICYDLRFPELARLLVLGGARLLVVPAEWPAARTGHWRTLLQSRAIENQCYVAGVNRIGSSNGVLFGGHSALIDPWGQRVGEAGEYAVILTLPVRPAVVDEVRRQVPALQNRVPEAYRIDTYTD
ncbi:MAG: carbon-nitrogen family hydrolase [Candidatus Deferrimicrobium sp.]